MNKIKEPYGRAQRLIREDFKLQFKQDEVCNIYSEWKSDSGEFLITGFEGIPQNLLINFICSIFVVVGFSFARRILWNYGRIAVIERRKFKWKEEYMPENEKTDEDDEKGRSLNIRLEVDHQEYMHPDGRVPRDTHDHEAYDDEIEDTGLFSWIKITYNLSEDVLYAKCGPDAVLYLRLQRHLIFLSCVVSLCSLLVILPIHILGEQQRDERFYQPSSFAQTTVANLPSDSPFIWVHVVMAFIYFVISVIVMRHFKRSFRPASTEDEVLHRSVMIFGIQRRMCHAEKILAHIKSLYPNCIVRECTFAYDTSKLSDLEWYKTNTLINLKHLHDFYEKTKRRPLLRPYKRISMALLPWFCCSKQEDAIRFYANEIRQYKKLADYERARTLGRPLGICFVTFRTAFTAERMIQDYGTHRRMWDYAVSSFGPFMLDRTPQSRNSRKMRAKEWFLYHAPSINDIHWENYGLTLLPWWLKAVMVNFTVILLALFFSTPIILIKTINHYVTFRGNGKGIEKPDDGSISISVIFYELFPTFLIWVGAVTLPSLVSVSDRMIGFWTRTAENQSRMIKTFSFLLIMVIILPSLGISSILYMVGANRLKWECIYSPSNSAFYMNYVITSCFVGTTSELWRFPELFYIVCKHLWKKSSYENPGIRTATLWEFQIGVQYAWMLLIFAVCSVFSLISPLITPLGVIYMCLKYFVDKHNIFFAYAKCSVDNSVHSTAVNFVMLCMFLLLTITTVFTNVAWQDQTYNPGLQAFASQLFILTLFMYVMVMYVDLNGALNTILFRDKELTPYYPEGKQGKKRRQNLKLKIEDNEKFHYKTVPRIPISPDNRYFAPMLRKDFPFATAPRQSLYPPITSRLDELLHYAELSLQDRPLFDRLVSSIESLTTGGSNLLNLSTNSLRRIRLRSSVSAVETAVGLRRRSKRSLGSGRKLSHPSISWADVLRENKK